MLYELMRECIDARYTNMGASSGFAVRRSGDALYIFFRGSEGEADWRRNLDFPAAAYKRMGGTAWYAHRGFLEAWRATEEYLAVAIASKTVKRITVTGYSHGAALALLCHEYIWYHRPELRASLTGYGFACPRVYWGIRFHHITERWERFSVIRNIGDIVTHLPPSALGYSHVGRMIEIGEADKYSPIDAHRPENILNELKIYESTHRH